MDNNTKSSYQRDESFRDSIATIDKKGKRNWIYPKQPFGKFYSARGVLSVIYLMVFFGLPFVKWKGDPLFLIDIVNRKFILFGVIFWPQDFFIFMLGMLTFIVFIILFTVAFGRLFCGWACPQTIFMEMVFRKIEYWIEGDFTQQKILNAQSWTREKIVKKSSKTAAFFLVSFLIANTFLSYLMGVDNLFKMISEPLLDNIGTFISLLIFTFVFFFVYMYFREQICIIVCPYGRLQGVMLDKNSIVVAYDYVRGEPRGKMKKGAESANLGDCVDCHQCVKVCPTGIDIRNGTQLECINCTACIDACDHMMETVNRPKGLIRYASENNISKKRKLTFTPRLMGYTLVLSLLIGILVLLLATRKDVSATIMRAQGMLYQVQPDNKISNLYNIKIINKTRKLIPVQLKLENMQGEISMIGKDIVLQGESIADSEFFVKVPKEKITKHQTKIQIGIYSNGKKIQVVKTGFMGPFSFK